MENKKQLIIIAGAAGEIGTEFIKKISNDEKNDVIAIVRNTPVEYSAENLTLIKCELSDHKDITNKFKEINFEKYSRVIYLHTIGMDKFDPRNYPEIKKMETIDPEVYNTNVNSFKYLMRYLVQKISELNEKTIKIHLKLGMIGGVGDKYTPFVIESFCEAKHIIRQYIQSQIQVYPNWISGLSINITSTLTKSALVVRPKADTTYWLTPEEVVTQGSEELLSDNAGFKEIDIIKSSPHYFKNYYNDEKTLYEKWMHETDYNNQ